MNLPLVARMWGDPTIRLRARAVDQNWYYQKAIPNPITGFNPFHNEIFYAEKSCFADWLKAPHRSARETNLNDQLVREVLFAVHDYLHIWARRAIQELRPDLGFGSAEITAKNIDRFVYCHLLTEAAAVIGLDYWFLSTFDFNGFCDIGTNFESLTVSYHEKHLPEYRRFFPEFTVQSPEFYSCLVDFYCTGEFGGFDALDLRRSPRLIRWLQHELQYGVKQREYARAWFAYLSPQAIALPASDLPVKCNEPWQRKLREELGERLWEKVKTGGAAPTPAQALESNPGKIWAAPMEKRADFRFANFNADRFQSERISGGTLEFSENSFEFLFYQWLSCHDFDSFDPSCFSLFPELLQQKNFALAARALDHLEPMQISGGERTDIFVLP